MAIEHFRNSDPYSGELIWNKRVVLNRIPPTQLKGLQSSQDIAKALENLIQKQLAIPFQGRDTWDDPHCKISDDGIFQYKKSLIPLASVVKNKDTFNQIIDKTPGDDNLKKELKELGNKLRNKLESEIIDGITTFLMRRGLEGLNYIIELLNQVE